MSALLAQPTKPDTGPRHDFEMALWQDACLAADIFSLFLSIGQFRNAAIAVKGQAGPVRDIWMERLRQTMPGDVLLKTVPTGISADRLIGGLDLSGTLSTGRKVLAQGLLAQADGHVLLLPMADLGEAETISTILTTMESETVRVERDGVSRSTPTRFGIVAFDESTPGEEALAKSLSDRLTLHIDLTEISIRTARHRFRLDSAPAATAGLSDEQRGQLCDFAASLGLLSLRPAMQTVELAKARCRLLGRSQVDDSDIAAAVRLGLAHRAEHVSTPPPPEAQPETESEENNTSEQREEQQQNDSETNSTTEMPEDILLNALASALPAGLLAELQSKAAMQATRSKAGRRGAQREAARRGRPLTSRKGDLRSGKRLDLMATLRAAAPWQPLRRSNVSGVRRIHIRPSDFHVRRFRQHTETSTIFVVDASGSTAMNRLAETKGAIELLLGETYARRDHVALISFRGTEAELLLAPTRALVRARRSLAALPGGGGTPLASGLQAALATAEEEARRGREPSIILLTDGSANVGADGAGGRKQAMKDAEKAAAAIAQAGFRTILIDVSRQPQPRAQNLAGIMDAAYVPMPFANSKNLSDAVRAAL